MAAKNITYSEFLKRVHDAIKHYGMINEGDKVLVAVSGGADSVCLLESLFALRQKLGIDLVVANMDHGLRGAESARDSKFVKKLAKDLGVECLHKKIDLSSSKRKDLSTEELARKKRYEFLVKSAEKADCNIIATGHTMDDQAETVLMRVLVGSSTKGIAGIPPVRKEKGKTIIRPLIRVERADIINFLKKNGSGYVEDSSNKDTKFLRNKVRIDVLPYLGKYNPSIKRSLVNLSDNVREDMEFLEDAKKEVRGKHLKADTSRVSIKIRDIILQPKVLRKELFKELFTRAGGNVKKLTYRHWMDMDNFLRSSEKGKALDLPGGVRVVRKTTEIVFEKRF